MRAGTGRVGAPRPELGMVIGGAVVISAQHLRDAAAAARAQTGRSRGRWHEPRARCWVLRPLAAFTRIRRCVAARRRGTVGPELSRVTSLTRRNTSPTDAADAAAEAFL